MAGLRVRCGRRRNNRHDPHQATNVLIPLLPKELLVTTAEMVCYFCTAIGVMVTVALTGRR